MKSLEQLLLSYPYFSQEVCKQTVNLVLHFIPFQEFMPGSYFWTLTLHSTPPSSATRQALFAKHAQLHISKSEQNMTLNNKSHA